MINFHTIRVSALVRAAYEYVNTYIYMRESVCVCVDIHISYRITSGLNNTIITCFDWRPKSQATNSIGLMSATNLTAEPQICDRVFMFRIGHSYTHMEHGYP